MSDFYKEPKKPRMLECGIEFFGQTTPPGATAAHAHVHDSVEMLFITDGSFTVSCEGISATAAVGDFVLFRSNCIHTAVAGGGDVNRYDVLKLDPSLIFALMPERTAGKYSLCLTLFSDESEFIWHGAQLRESDISLGYERLKREESSELATRDIAMRSAAFTVICGIIRELESAAESSPLPTSVYSQIYKSMRYMNDRFSDDITAEQMAEMLNVSYSYFSRSFSHVTGKSFRQYLNLIRIRKAEQLLLTTDKSVTEISGLCGYNNVSHFIATYKKIKGKTPSRQKRKN